MEEGGYPRLRLWLLSAGALILVGIGAGPASAGGPLSYERREVAGVELHVIEIDLNDRRLVVSPAVAARGIGHGEEFSAFIERLAPAAAINGTFFDKTTLRPVADIVIDGKLAHFGGMGTAVAFAQDGVDFVRLPKSQHVDWCDHGAAIAGGPLLVWEGFAKPSPGGEGFGDPAVFARAAPRTAIGITAQNHLLLVTTARGTSLGKLAAAMRSMGCLYAFNLDGGGSAAMWFRGKMIVTPKRPLTNVICLYVRDSSTSRKPLRPPRGLDWRSGHRPRPVLHFAAGDVRVWAHLPREWAGKQSVIVEADALLPEGWLVSVRLDDEMTPTVSAKHLPAELHLDLSRLTAGKHRIWIEILDGESRTVGGIERIFLLGTAGHHAW